jgi:tRNA-Thr(GGU) m(6)t(6)A37 methyltransferase TsaA
MSNNHTINDDTILMKPIGYMESVFNRKNATPRQGSLAPSTKGKLKLLPQNCFGPRTTHQSLMGLEEFSHVWIIYLFHDNGEGGASLRPKITPPRLNGKRVGVFATRTPHRPNPIGLTLAKLESIDDSKGIVYFSGIDLINGTPVLDIKPFIPDYDNAYQLMSTQLLNQQSLSSTTIENSVKVAKWVTQGGTIKNIDTIIFTDDALEQLQRLIQNDHRLKFYKDWNDARVAIEQLLYLDPRSVHRRKKGEKAYWFHLDGMNISTKIEEDDEQNPDSTITATVLGIEMWQDVLDRLDLTDEETRGRKGQTS